ncbi:PREDICTED: UBX domain-containing protein 11 [Cyprinodon variegatus]|uniref:UBX domain-containing protein 11 n=1 Tax=Cyprinodon variegatus TaxID=28743 RepID=UPI0007429251|nr:PREDICTED: UBX domain-containing protein 11 [Cyprinodon variegatus]
MSSPSSMERKTRRSPLQGPLMNEQGEDRSVLFKRNQLQDSPPSDFELMAAMMQRITTLENRVRSQAQELEQQDEIISVLEEQLRSRGESDLESPSCSREDLEKKCQLLQNKLQEMEIFLSDYGLIWVGDRDSSDSEESQCATSSHGLPTEKGFQVNFDLVLQRIRELNALAGEETFVQVTGNRAKLVKKDPIQLKLYKNGIVMFDGPFRSYQDQSTQRCMEDLMDGYFPSELQQRFPDGVPLEVHDRRDEEFMFREPWDTIPGERQAVYRDESTNSFGFLPGGRLTTDQFLSKLPKVVVKAGNVIHIRSSMRRTLQGASEAQCSSSETLINTPALHSVKGRTQMKNCEKTVQALITLKLKSEDGNHIYVMKMSPSETVGQLRAYLDIHRGAGQPDYDIISAYPPCSFSDDGCTLQSCGLSSNATLLLRRREQSKQ